MKRRGAPLLAIVIVFACASGEIDICGNPNEPHPSHWESVLNYSQQKNILHWKGDWIVFPHLSAIYAVKPDGTELRRVSKKAGRWEEHYSPSMTSDGSRVAYTTTRHKVSRDSGNQRNFDIEIATPRGKERVRLTDSGKQEVSPVFSPDGTRIAFEITWPGPDHIRDGIYIMAANGSDARWISAGTRVSWAPTSDALAFVSRGGLFTINMDGSDQTLRFETLVVERAVKDPPFPPIVVLSEIVGGSPAWSPDGEQIAFFYFLRGDHQDYIESDEPSGYALYLVSTRGSGRERVELPTGHWGNANIDWSPDGKHILLAPQNGGLVTVLDLDGGTATGIARGRMASWSPDGQEIAVAAECDWGNWGDGNDNYYCRDHRLSVPSLPGDFSTTGILLYTVTPEGLNMRPLVKVDNYGRLEAAGK